MAMQHRLAIDRDAGRKLTRLGEHLLDFGGMMLGEVQNQQDEAARSEGNEPSTRCIAVIPPAEAPMATMSRLFMDGTPKTGAGSPGESGAG